MSLFLRRPAVVLLICWLSVQTAAHATDAGVTDFAGLFSPEAVEKAAADLKDVQRKTKKAVVVETYRGIPADKRQAFRSNREKFYQDWAVSRHAALRMEGILFLVVQETAEDVAAGARPRNRIEFFNDKETSRFFTRDEVVAARDKLGKALGARNGNIDQGLLDMTAYTRTTIVKNFEAKNAVAKGAQKAARKQAPADVKKANDEQGIEIGTILLYAGGSILGLWILMGLVRALTRPRMDAGAYGPPPPPGSNVPPPPPGYGQPQHGHYSGQPMGMPPQRGGMGFFGSLMTGMLGAAAGNYMYDRFFRGGHHPTGGDYGGTPADSGAGGGFWGSQPNDAGQAFGGGADYDQFDPPASGGGDWGGGGDFGGGDFGGGDY